MTRESVLADLRLTLRQLRRAPAYAAVTIATLGLGIGATAAIFSVAHAVLLKPLPYRDPSRLVSIWSNNSHLGEPRNPVSPANFDAFRRDAKVFAGVEAMYSFFTNAQIERAGDREIVVTSTVSAGMFDLIGRPAFVTGYRDVISRHVFFVGPAMKKLAAALNSPEVKQFIADKYKGAVVPAF